MSKRFIPDKTNHGVTFHPGRTFRITMPTHL